MLVLPILWVWMGLEMFWLFSVSVCRMGAVSFGMSVLVFVRYLFMLSSGKMKCGDRTVFGVWFRELLSVGYL